MFYITKTFASRYGEIEQFGKFKTLQDAYDAIKTYHLDRSNFSWINDDEWNEIVESELRIFETDMKEWSRYEYNGSVLYDLGTDELAWTAKEGSYPTMNDLFTSAFQKLFT